MRHETTTDARFVDLDELVCPRCGDQVSDEPEAGFIHLDGAGLCPTPGGVAAGPVEVTR